VPGAANLARKRPRAHPRAGNEARRFSRARAVSSATGRYKTAVDPPYRCARKRNGDERRRQKDGAKEAGTPTTTIKKKAGRRIGKKTPPAATVWGGWAARATGLVGQSGNAVRLGLWVLLPRTFTSTQIP